MRRNQGFENRQGARRGAEMRAARLAGMLLLGAAELAAQSRPSTPARAEAPTAQAERRIVVSFPDHKLALVEGGVVVKVFPVAVGRRISPSPAGTFRIATRVSHPAYYRPGVVIPPGANNPVGTRWMGLSKPGYGIHGTNQPRSIGRDASHGCIRMRNRDAEDLFARVRVGDTVELHPAADAVTLALFHGGEQQAPATVVAASFASAEGH
jgi:hypothetical protein